MDRRHLCALLVLAITACSASPASAQQPALPKPGEGFEVWCQRLQDAEPFVPFRCTVEDPRKPAEVWESTLTVRRAADGSLQELRWYERREAWGRTVLARRVDDQFVD
ncbi:MAG: hypothetical protein ACKO7G_05970 [Gammaproteobacteria bacterium]